MNVIEQSKAYVDHEVKKFPIWHAGTWDISNHRTAKFSKSKVQSGVFAEEKGGSIRAVHSVKSTIRIPR